MGNVVPRAGNISKKIITHCSKEPDMTLMRRPTGTTKQPRSEWEIEPKIQKYQEKNKLRGGRSSKLGKTTSKCIFPIRVSSLKKYCPDRNVFHLKNSLLKNISSTSAESMRNETSSDKYAHV